MPNLNAKSFDDPAWEIVTQGEKDRKSGRYVEAIQRFTTALDSFADSAPVAAIVETLICRGVARAQSGDTDSAMEDFSEALRLDPKRALAYYNRGYSYELRGLFRQAIDEYSRAIECDPDSGRLYLRRGVCWKRLNDPAKARSDFAVVRRLGTFKASKATK